MVSCVFFAGNASDHDIAAVHPYPHVPARHKVGITVVAEPATELVVDPDPLAHRDPPGKFDVAVRKERIFCIHPLCLPEQYRDALPRDHLC
jgi:hypothetical protein